MRIRPVILVSGTAVLVLGLALTSVRLVQSHPAATTEHPVTVPATPRTVTVSRTMPAQSASPRHLSALLAEGTMPSRRTMAEVMSDTECTPDDRMVSRCRNEIRLDDDTTIVVRHPHDMRRIPCLAPGERVLLVPSA